MPRRKLDPEQVLLDVGRRIGELRERVEWTQQKLADEIGVGWKYEQQVELGYENLTLKSLTRYANALEVDLVELVTPPEKKKPRPGRPPRRKVK